MMSKKLKVNGILEESIVDGPGIRYTIFLQGCPHNCTSCHNPETHSFVDGYEAYIDSIFLSMKENLLITGVTFSGGEPMCQAKELCELARMIKSIGLEIAIYSGYTFEYLIEENNYDRIQLLELCDILIDGKFEEEQHSLSLLFKGSSNQNIVDLKKSLKTKTSIHVTNSSWVRG